MAEEALIAELRLGYDKFQQDLQRAQRAAGQQSRDISDALGKIDNSVRPLPESFKRFNRSLDETKKSAQVASQETSRLSGVLTSLKSTLGVLGLAFGVREMVRFASSAAHAGEAIIGLQTQLEVITGSAEATTRAMSFVATETDAMAHDVVGGTRMFAQLAAALKTTETGAVGAEVVYQGLSRAITATGGTAKDLQSIVSQLSRSINRGTMDLRSFNALTQAGIPAQEMLAKRLGFTAEAFEDAMKDGVISAEALILLGQELTDTYTQAAEEMASRIPAGFRRLTSRIGDEFMDLFAAIFESVELMKYIGPILDTGNFFPDRAEITEKIDEIVGQFTKLTSIATLLTNIIFENFKKGWQELADLLGTVDTFIKRQFDKIPMPEWVNKLGAATNKFLTGAKEKVDDVKKSLEEMSITELLFNKDDVIGSLTEIEERLKKSLGIENAEILDPKKTGAAAKSSTKAVSDEYKELEEKIKNLLSAPSKVEVEKQASDALKERERLAKIEIAKMKKWYEEGEKAKLKAEEDYYKERFKLIDRETAREQKKREENAKADIEMARAVHQIKLDLIKAQGVAGLTVPEVQPPTSDAIKRSKELAEAQEEIFKNMRENIQREMGNIFTDIFSGQLDSIQDFADKMVDIFARTAAEIIVAMAIQPMMEDAFASLQNMVKDFSIQMPGAQGGTVTGQQIMGGIGVAGAAVGTGAAVSGIAGGGIAGNVLGGAAAGAMMGAMVGAWAGPFALVGAAVGGVVGALAGLTMALLDTSEKIRIAPLTSSAPPTGNIEQGVVRRGPFGFISLVDQSSNTGADTNTVTAIIAEADAAIARLMTQRQREIAAAALEGQHYALDAKAMDDAIAQTLQTRLFIILRDLAGQDAALQIVGEPYTGTAENIQLLQQRAAEALGILKMIEDFKISDLGRIAVEISQVQEQFNNLIDRATQLGMDQQAAELAARRDQEIQKITTDFNTNVRHQILGFIDPAQQAGEELERLQEEIWQNAVAAGADLAAVQELFALQWEDHAARFGSAGLEGSAGIEALAKSIEQFGRAGLSGTTQQLIALREQFETLQAEALRLGHGVEELTASYHQQHDAIIIAAQRNVQAAILAIVDPFGAAMLQIQIQIEEFQRLANEGFIDQSIVDSFRQAAEEQARYNEAIRIASGSAGSAQESFNRQIEAFNNADLNLSNAERRIQDIEAEFQRLFAALMFLGLDTSGIEASRDRQIAQVQQEEEERQREEAKRAREQREAEARQRREERKSAKESIDAFRRATMSQPGQQIASLTERFLELSREAHRLGLSTKALTASYHDQVKEIGRQAYDQIHAVVQSFGSPFESAKREAQKQIDELNKLAKDGLVAGFYVQYATRLIQADKLVQEALRRISGAPVNSIKQLADSFDQFIRAGNPLSGAGQELYNLTENFINLADAAHLLGFSTAELEESYLAQSQIIRERIIKDIDSQLSAQIQAIESIGNYLDSLRVSEERPLNLRLDEAQVQFQAAMGGEDVSKMISAADTLRDIARQQFGSGHEFFQIESQIASALVGIQSREQAIVDSERQRMTDQIDREIRGLQVGQSSLDQLQRVAHFGSEMARGVDELAALARQSAQREQATINLLERVLAEGRR